MSKNAVALFTGVRSVTGAAIRWATGCEFVHGAIKIDGVWYDASEKRGNFAEMDENKYKHRRCVVFELPDSDTDKLKAWLDEHRGRKYDWSGVLLWIFKHRGDLSKFFCFEAQRSGLRRIGFSINKHPLSGCHILEAFEDRHIRGEYGHFWVKR